MPAWLAVSLATTALGVVASAAVAVRLALSERLALGAALGVAFWRWAPWLASLTLGIEHGAWAALVLAGALAGLGLAQRSLRARLAAEVLDALAALRTERSVRLRLAVFSLFAALAVLICARYYLPEDERGILGMENLHDLAGHLMYVNAFRWSLDGAPLEQPNAPGVPLGYHFLPDAATAAVCALGAEIGPALRSSAVVALVAGFVLAFHLLRRWLASDAKAWTALALLFLGGGFGFVLAPKDFAAGAMPWLSPTYDFDAGLQYGELLVDVLLPARAAQSGLPIVLAALLLLDRSCDREHGTWGETLAGSALVGSLPLIHAHSALAAGIIATCWALTRAPSGRRALAGAALAVALGLPQALWLHTQRSGYAHGAHLEAFWMAHDLHVGPLALWTWCLGPFLALVAAGFFAASRAQRLAVAPMLALFALGNAVSFTTIPFDNVKLFAYFQLGGAVLAAEALSALARRGRLAAASAALAFTLATLSGAITVGLAATRPLVVFIPRSDVVLGELVRSVTNPDDLVLTATHQCHPVALFTGRRVVLGNRECLREDGVDTEARAEQVRAVYENGPRAAELLAALRVDWVVVGPFERREFPKLDERRIASLAREMLRYEDTTLYRLR